MSAIIIDIGNHYTKVGLSCNNVPIIIETKLYNEQKIISFNSLSLLSSSKIYYILSTFIKSLYINHLLINPNSRRVLLCTSILWNNNIIKILLKIFHDLNIPSFKLINSLILPIYNFNRQTALIVEISNDETRILPIYKGHPMTECFTYGSIDMSNNIPIYSSNKLTIIDLSLSVSDVLSSLTNLSLLNDNYIYDFISRVVSISPLPIPLNNNTVISLAEVYFNEINSEITLTNLIFKSILSLSIEVRRDLFNSIIICGGGWIPGLADRLTSELEILIKKKELSLSVGITERSDSSLLVWKGAAIVANVSDEGFVKCA